jgi:hypothetical protein
LSAQPFFIGRGGLHALEADLFTPFSAPLATDCTSLAVAGVDLVFGLSHTVATPSRIANDAANLATWLVERVIAQPQEVFARSQSIDSSAVVYSVASWWAFIRPLEAIVQPAHCTPVDLAIRNITADQERIGIAGTPDALVSDAKWASLAQDSTYLARLFTNVASDLYGFGAGRTYA